MSEVGGLPSPTIPSAELLFPDQGLPLRLSNWTENERSPGALSRQDEMSDEG